MDDREEEEGRKGEGDASNQSKPSFINIGNTTTAAPSNQEEGGVREMEKKKSTKMKNRLLDKYYIKTRT